MRKLYLALLSFSRSGMLHEKKNQQYNLGFGIVKVGKDHRVHLV